MSESSRQDFGTHLDGLSRRRLLAGMGGVAALAGLALVGCSSGDDPPASGGGPGATPTAVPANATPTPGPKPGGSIVFADGADPDNFDPVYAGYIGQYITSATHNRLLAWKHGADVFQLDYTATTDDGLASAFEQPDPLTYTFTLRSGIKFQNKAPVNGATFTAKDVESTFKRLKDGAREFVLTPTIDSVTAIDDTHVRFKMKTPYAPFSSLIGHTNFAITSALQTEFGKAEQDNGTGPFMMDSYKQGVETVVKKNPAYWGTPRPYIDTLTYKVIADVNTIYAGARAGTIDWPMFFWNGIPPSIASEIVSSNKNLATRPWQLTSPRFVTGRMDQAPLNDLRVRQAISYAIDRAQWIDLVREGKGRATGSMPYMLTKPWYLEPKELGETGKYLEINLAESKKLMEAAGLKDGFEMEIKPYTALTAKLPEMDLLTAQLAKINIKLKPVYLPGSQFLQQISREKNYTGMLFWTHGFTSDFDPLMYNTFVTTNLMMIKDDKLKGFMDKQRITLDAKERATVIHDYQKYQAEQCYALYEPVADQQMVYPKTVANWGPHNSFDVGGVAASGWRTA